MNHSYLTTSYRFFSDLFYSSKEGSEVRAAPAVRKFGCQFCWLEELANARSGVSPLVAFETRAVKRPQGAAQCGDLVSVRRFRHSGAKQANRPPVVPKIRISNATLPNCRFKRNLEPSANRLGFFRVSAPDWKVCRSSPFPKGRNPGFRGSKLDPHSGEKTAPQRRRQRALPSLPFEREASPVPSRTKRVRLVTMADTGKSGVKSDPTSPLNPSDSRYLNPRDSGYLDPLNARFKYRSSDELRL
ncbi:hypothetical protein [Pseudomonas sp. AAC]|uniref:hypothetical protein n=1 Tax=Pseudomonas sp. AAC TaxID=1502784 RepID=UPI0012DBEDC7|nr:hypothetical protein [Pseudomonas sp. AAC]